MDLCLSLPAFIHMRLVSLDASYKSSTYSAQQGLFFHKGCHAWQKMGIPVNLLKSGHSDLVSYFGNVCSCHTKQLDVLLNNSINDVS